MGGKNSLSGLPGATPQIEKAMISKMQQSLANTGAELLNCEGK